MSDRSSPTDPATENVYPSKSSTVLILKFKLAQLAILSAMAEVASTIRPLISSGQSKIHSPILKVTSGSCLSNPSHYGVRFSTVLIEENYYSVIDTFLSSFTLSLLSKVG